MIGLRRITTFRATPSVNQRRYTTSAHDRAATIAVNIKDKSKSGSEMDARVEKTLKTEPPMEPLEKAQLTKDAGAKSDTEPIKDKRPLTKN
ncbi:hypothetical protein PROFUN_03409 [Planoprotostelium fungivorum]|uniref:Uncharacterized protein n=1 Tax=Planoprotostelium fungivorum TaxID=1890364 RepID=A0A2P6NWG6_9EUKA|nr:hypothetical protein PROFUN_03409 [Planoprotostelium fungivorum]